VPAGRTTGKGHEQPVEITDDPTAPIFFLSYGRARLPNRPVGQAYEPDEEVLAFFTELSAHIHRLEELPLGQDAGFMDRTLDGGQPWKQELLRGVGTAQVFVALLSDRYLRSSEWCAREWHAFARRSVVNRDRAMPPTETGILPVLWTPFHRATPPQVDRVASFMPTGLPDPSHVRFYLENGLLGLLELGLNEVYRAIVWKVALRVMRIRSTHWVKPRVPRGTKDLRRSFGRAHDRGTA
jgi:hypothetical protein